jgi:predicted amidohydrolase YtcJ
MIRLTALLATCLLLLASPSAWSDEADSVFLGGKIYTVDSRSPWAEAVAVKNGVIVYVGDEDGATQFIGPETHRYRLGDQLLLPGFIDTHAHPILAAASMNMLEIEDNDDLDAIYKKLKSYARKNPELPLIAGHGFSPTAFEETPTSAMLDQVISERPVFLIDSGGHLGWANTKAFELAGVTADTPDPAPGSHYYVRDALGKPTGYMFEESTFLPFVVLNQDNSVSEIEENAAELFPLMSSFGITSVFDASMEWLLDQGLMVMHELEANHELPFRMVASMTIEANSTIETELERYRKLQAKYNSDRLKVGAVKIGLDGTLEGMSAALLGTYLPGGSGALNWDPLILQKHVVALDKEGVDVHIHAIGDRAVNEALNAIEAARTSNHSREARHTICHTQLVQESDIARFTATDTIAQTTPIWHAEMPGFSWREISDDYRDRLFPFNSLAKTGARVTFGSDFPYGGPLETLIPAYNIQVGHTRVWPGNDDAEPLPQADERLDLETLVRGYKLDAAYQLQMKNLIGSIKVGKRADLIVLDENLFEVSTDEIHEIDVNLTMVDGDVVYERPFYQWLIEWWLEI